MLIFLCPFFSNRLSNHRAFQTISANENLLTLWVSNFGQSCLNKNCSIFGAEEPYISHECNICNYFPGRYFESSKFRGSIGVQEYFINFYKGNILKYSLILAVLPQNLLDTISNEAHCISLSLSLPLPVITFLQPFLTYLTKPWLNKNDNRS